MELNKIRLNFDTAHVSPVAELIAIAGMIPESIAGASMQSRKLTLYIDPAIAASNGIVVNDAAPQNDVLMDYDDLSSRSAGLCLADSTAPSSFIDFETSDPTIGSDIHDVGSVLMLLSKPKAIELKFNADLELDDNGIVMPVRGTSADLIADMAEPVCSTSIAKSAIGAFFGSLSEYIEGLAVHHTANGLDKSTDALTAGTAEAGKAGW